MKKIYFSGKKYSHEYILVDDHLYDELNQYKWYKHTYGYAYRFIINSKEKEYLHRRLTGLLPGDKLQVDHKNGITYDNRLENLRVCSQTENARNTSKINKQTISQYKGLRFKDNQWETYIKKDKYLKYIGTYKTELAAAMAYDKEAKILFGEFAKCNLSYIDENFLRENKINSSSRGKSKYYGISYHKTRKRWIPRLGKKEIGYFKTEEEAYSARLKYLSQVFLTIIN